MKRIGAAAAMAAMTIVVAALCGVALADDSHGPKPDKPAPPPKAAKHDESKPAKPAKSESASKPDEQKASEPEAKVYICHATGSAKNPYVLINVSSHALKAHTSHQDGRDIVLGASPGACPGASATSDVKAAEESKQLVSFCDMETATTGKFETKDAKEVVKHELDGKPEEARDIVPTFSYN
ncbi:MAG TPA: hypothetical protein VLE97_04615, partial [Gaiellaceae bacterium]|nr:hypothetical protein [Gaiellaceae bacterium]